VTGVLALPWPFEREYMQLALAAGLVIGICAPLIGTFLVQQRLSLMGDGIGHLALTGIAAGLLLEVWPVWSAMVVAAAGALSIEWLRSRRRTTSDLALALWFYGGIAGGVVLASRSTGGSSAILPYLFGSILTVQRSEVVLIAALGLVIVLAVVAFGRTLFAIVIDEESARVAGLPVGAGNAVLAVLTAVTVVAAMQVVGVLLVAALMVLPVATSRVLARSFRGTLLVGAAVGAFAVVAGLAAARQWALAPGGSIVLVAAGTFAVVGLVGGRAAQRRPLLDEAPAPGTAPTGTREPHDGHDHDHPDPVPG
jgi:zinc transport system permease protein